MALRVVMDTNVLVSALRSSKGASFKFLSLVGAHRFSLCVSVPLILEYEAAVKKQAHSIGLATTDIGAIIDYICSVAEHYKVYYLWRPFLRNPSDDMVLELAVSSNAYAIVTYNKADFKGIEQLGVKTVSPKEFLEELGEIA